MPVGITPTPSSLNVPMYMIVNLAIGGRWPGFVNAETPPETEMQIDWIAAYVVR